MWSDISCKMIRILRGKRSQLALSRRLGYQSNPVREWEAGRRFPTAAETLRLAKTVGVNVHGAFTRFHAGCAPILFDSEQLDDDAVARWLSALRGSTTVAELARRSGESRYALSRLFAGQTRPRLPAFLHLVDVITGRVSALVAELVDIRRLPELSAVYERHCAAKELAFLEPWSEAIVRLIETEAYRALPRHIPGWIACRLGIDEATESRCIDKMVHAGVIAKGDGKFCPSAPLSVDTSDNPKGVLQIKRHWAQVATARLSEPTEGDLFAYNAISLSHQDLARVRTLLQHTYREIRAIVAASPNEETAALVQLQLVDWSASQDDAKLVTNSQTS